MQAMKWEKPVFSSATRTSCRTYLVRHRFVRSAAVTIASFLYDGKTDLAGWLACCSI